MNIETRKIALACFIGGVLCSGVALAMSPAFWWVGLIAGFCGGYVGYEFREMLKAVPVAWRMARRGVGAMPHLLMAFVKLVFQPRPLFHFSLVLMIGFFVCFGYTLHYAGEDLTRLLEQPVWVYGLVLIALAILTFRIWAILDQTAKDGAKRDGCMWIDGIFMQSDGYTKAAYTYTNVSRWLLKDMWFETVKLMKGMWLVIVFLLWEMWKFIAVGMAVGFLITSGFVWNLFKLIHSDKRVLCALDGTLGGAASYFMFGMMATSPTLQILCVLFGGFIGAAFGILNWELVSKRLLHVAE